MRILFILYLCVLGCLATNKDMLCGRVVKRSGMKVSCIRKAPLGTGTFGSVYLVQNAQGERMALKFIPLSPGSERDTRASIREGELLEKARGSKHVIHLFDRVTNDYGYFLLMEYAELGNLRAFQKNNPELFSNKYFILKMTNEVAKGVQEIHNLGFSVQDLKLQNLVVTRDLTVKIIDLGDAVPWETNCLRTGGTYPFIDVRVWDFLADKGPHKKSELPVDPLFDVFAIGSSIYVMLTDLIPPFAANRKDREKQVHLNPITIPPGTELNTALLINWCRLLDASQRPTVAQIIALTDGLLDLSDQNAVFDLVHQTESTPKTKIERGDFEKRRLDYQASRANEKKILDKHLLLILEDLQVQNVESDAMDQWVDYLDCVRNVCEFFDLMFHKRSLLGTATATGDQQISGSVDSWTPRFSQQKIALLFSGVVAAALLLSLWYSRNRSISLCPVADQSSPPGGWAAEVPLELADSPQSVKVQQN